jgi:hypothetical protein
MLRTQSRWLRRVSILLLLFAIAGEGESAAQSVAADTLTHTSVMDTVGVKPVATDTAAPKNNGRLRSTLNDTWYYAGEPNKHYLIDSSISQLHRYDIVHRDGPEYFNMGNTGTEAYSTVFNPSPTIGFNMGFHQFDPYTYTKDSIRYYQVIRPYAEIFYDLSIKKEQVFEGRFANFHKKTGILYGVDFHRINSPGTYANQKALDNGFSLYGIYNSKSRVFNIETDLIYNSFIVQENGGLTSDIFYNGTSSSFLSQDLVPVNLNNAVLNYNEINWFLKGSYNVGKKYNERVNDTLVRRVVLPVFKVSYQLNTERNRYSYFDINNDSAYYSQFSGQGFVNPTQRYISTGDTLRYTSKYIKIGQRLGLDYDAKKLTSDSTYKELNFLMGAALDFDYYTVSEFGGGDKFSNLSVSGYLKSNPAVNPRLIYSASVAYYVAGYNQNDLMANGQVGADLRAFGRLTAGAGYQLKEADYVYHSFRADSSTALPYTNSTGTVSYITHDNLSYSYLNNFPKMSTFKVGGEYLLEKYGIKVSAYNYILKNYFYFSGPDMPAYESNTINMLVLYFANRFGFKGIHFDNDVWFQKSAGSDVIRLPLVSLKSSLYYERHVFKNALWFAIGGDVRYYTPFDANGYNPLFGQFYTQNQQQMKFYPILDLFLNVKVKTVRIFLEGTNISGLFGPQHGYYTAYYYPAADVTFRFGAAWRFFE